MTMTASLSVRTNSRREEIPRSTDFRYGQTVLLVQLVDVRPRRLDDVRHNGSEGGPAGSGEPDGGRSCPPSRVIEAPRVV